MNTYALRIIFALASAGCADRGSLGGDDDGTGTETTGSESGDAPPTSLSSGGTASASGTTTSSTTDAETTTGDLESDGSSGSGTGLATASETGDAPDFDGECTPFPDDCPDGEVCLHMDGWMCVPDVSNGTAMPGGVCDFANSCGPGLTCAPTGVVLGCPADAFGCCAEYCWVSRPHCSACVPIFDDPPDAASADLGICSDPLG